METAFESRAHLDKGFAPFKDGGESGVLRQRRQVSLAANLVVLVSLVALPLIVLGAGGLWLQYRSERLAAEAQLVEQARSTALLIDREFERTLAVAQTLAAAVPAVHGDLDVLEGELRRARDLLGATLTPGTPRPALVLVDAHGVRLLHTDWAPHERLGGVARTRLVHAAIAERTPQISDLIIGPGAAVPMVGVAVPVFYPMQDSAEANRAVVGGISISIPREQLMAVVQHAGLHPGAVASVLDRDGIVVARSFRDADFVGNLPAPSMLQAITSAQAGIAPPESLPFGASPTEAQEDNPSTIAFAHSPHSGYVVKINVPEEVFLAPLRYSLIRSAGIGIMVLLAGIALALVSAHRIVKAFHLALGSATKGSMPDQRHSESTGLKEADELAALLTAAIAERENATGNAQALLDNSPIGIVVFDDHGAVHMANDAFLAIVGHTQAELRKGTFVWDAMTAAQWVAGDEAALAETMEKGRCRPYEKEYLRPDGSTVPVLVSLGLMNRGSGWAIEFVIDLTKQRLQQTAQTEVEDRLRFSLIAGGLGIWDLDLATQKIRCSETGPRLSGATPGNVFSFSELLALIHADDREHVRDVVIRATVDGRDFWVEYRVQWPDQGLHWLEVRGRVIPHAGKPVRLTGVCADITERKQSEAALRYSEVRLRAITDSMPQIVWSTRPDGYNDYFNQRWYDLTGMAPEQTEGVGWFPMVHPADREHTRARWRHSLATGVVFESELRLRGPDGSYRWMLGRGVPIRDRDDGDILRWFGTCTDIEDTVNARETFARSREDLERLVAERTSDLQATQVRLAQAQRMEALGQLAGGIAHDFNNVLQAVQGSGSLLAQNATDADAVRRHARIILEATQRGAATTRRLLSFSRRGDLHAEPVDPAMLQNSMWDILTHTLGDGVKIEIELAPNLVPLLADKGQLETVLINLATNGRDAMGGIGTLTLAAAIDVVQPAEVQQHPGRLKAGSYVRLSVTDTGTGMDARTLSRASEPFFTTKPMGKGTGLGLAMARGFAEQSDGGLHIASMKGEGTTVTLWLPVATAGLRTLTTRGEAVTPTAVGY